MWCRETRTGADKMPLDRSGIVRINWMHQTIDFPLDRNFIHLYFELEYKVCIIAIFLSLSDGYCYSLHITSSIYVHSTMKNGRSNESCQHQKQSINQVHRVHIRCRRPTIRQILMIIRCAIIVELDISVIMGGKSKIFDLKRAGLLMSENGVPFNRQRQYTI